MEKIDTITAQYVFQNSAAYARRVNKSSDSGASDNAVGGNAQNIKTELANGLTASQLSVIEKLQSRDLQVRSHEMAHVSAGGQYVTSGVNFSYQKGPDGKMYAVGGEVGIDLSPIANNPQATIAKMMIVRNAALAPADPSPQDRSVAAAASSMLADAQTQLIEMQTEKAKESRNSGTRVNGSKLYENNSETLNTTGTEIDLTA